MQQYIVDRLYAENRFLATALRDACTQTLRDVRNPRVKSLSLRKFSAGAKPPKLLAARAYDAPDSLAFDIEVRWESEIAADIDMVVGGGPLSPRVPVTVRNFRFDGPVRLVATPLLSDPPGFGALLLSLPAAPRIGLDVRVAGGEVTRLPWLRDEIEQAMQDAIAKDLLWPNRLVISQARAPGQTPPPILSVAELQALATDDPLLRAEKALKAQPAVSALEKERPPPSKLSALLEIFVNATTSGGDGKLIY